jgi:hypothetical protein
MDYPQVLVTGKSNAKLRACPAIDDFFSPPVSSIGLVIGQARQ